MAVLNDGDIKKALIAFCEEEHITFSQLKYAVGYSTNARTLSKNTLNKLRFVGVDIKDTNGGGARYRGDVKRWLEENYDLDDDALEDILNFIYYKEDDGDSKGGE